MAIIPLSTRNYNELSSDGWLSNNGELYLSGDELRTLLSVQAGDMQRYPKQFWHDDDGWERAIACLRYVLEVLEAADDRDKVIALASKRTLLKYHLLIPIQYHRRTIYDYFCSTYPEYEIMPWELHQVPVSYWKKGGDEVKRRAMVWWLRRMGISAKDALRMLESKKYMMRQLLRASGLNELVKEHGLRPLLHLIDESIDPNPVSLKELRRRRAKLLCPVLGCGEEMITLFTHARKKHGISAAELRLLIDRAETSEANQHRRRAGQVAKSPAVALYRARGLSLPGSWWPDDAKYASFRIDDGNRIVITPSFASADNTRYVSFSRRNPAMRKRISIQSKPILSLLRGDTLSITCEGGSIVIKVASKDTAEAIDKWFS